MADKKKLAILAIGGNSLILDKDHKSVPDQYDAVEQTCTHIAGLVKKGYRVVITHGNGPQVGFILRRSELSRGDEAGIKALYASSQHEPAPHGGPLAIPSQLSIKPGE